MYINLMISVHSVLDQLMIMMTLSKFIKLQNVTPKFS